MGAVPQWDDRALFHLPTFAVTDQNAPALASICHRLDGIPLAIELAAARVRLMSLDEIDHRLDHSFKLLTGGSRTHLPRQQTLRSLIDWSYQLLSPAEQRLLSRLSVFWGGWTFESAEEVCSSEGLERDDVLDLMSSLVDKSLIVPEEREGSMRYRLLETIRQFAAERLAEGDRAALSTRHLAYFRSLTAEHESDFRGPKLQEWTSRLETDNDNIRAALRWSIEDGHDLQLGLELAASIWRFWYHRGHLAEGSRWLMEVERPEAAVLPLAVQAKALNGAGVMAWNRGDYSRACGLHERALTIHRELDDRKGIAISLNNLGLAVFDQGDYELAESLYGQSVAILKELGDRYGVASLLNSQGNSAFYYGSLEEACLLLEESIEVKRQIGDRHGIAMSLGNLALATKERGQLDQARALISEAAVLYRELGDRTGTQIAQQVRGDILVEDGDLQGAAAFLAEALQIATADGMLFRIATTLESYASLAVALNRIREAALLWGYAAKVREDIGTARSPHVKRAQDRRIAVARKACGDDVQFDAWWYEGSNLAPDQAVSLAKETAEPR